MLRLTALIVVLAALGAGTASAATPGWSTTKAATAVTASVSVPWCRVFTDWHDVYGRPQCAAGKAVTQAARTHAPFKVQSVTCTGNLPASGGFKQLRCYWSAPADSNSTAVLHGAVMVYVTGPKTFRWKSL